MSKIINLYRSLKKVDSNTLYLFKSGIFYIFIDSDAVTVSNALNLKLTNLNTDVVKCGFPQNSLTKYLQLLKQLPLEIKIIDSNTYDSYSVKDFSINNNVTDLLNIISNVDEETLSITEAYSFINKIKVYANNIINGI